MRLFFYCKVEKRKLAGALAQQRVTGYSQAVQRMKAENSSRNFDNYLLERRRQLHYTTLTSL